MSSLSPEACLFVANLPSRLTNEELSYRLLDTFKRFGHIISIKTSRDAKGRPFGFVQFEKVEHATNAVKNKSKLLLCGRHVRIEKARCLRKIQIILPDESLCLEDIRELLTSYSSSEDIVHLDSDSEEGINKNGISEKKKQMIVIKLLDSVNADQSFNEIKEDHPDWILTWLNVNNDSPTSEPMSDKKDIGDNCIGISYRQGSIPVNPDKLIPNNSKEDRILLNNLTELSKGLKQMNLNGGGDYHRDRAIEDNLIMNGDDETSCLFETKIENEEEKNSQVESKEIFVGRLNAHRVDEDMVHHRFSKYGELVSVHMVNKQSPGIPQDAFAFITYKMSSDAQRAIDEENGKVWMGQPIKVSWAIPKPHSSSLRGGSVQSSSRGRSRYPMSSMTRAHWPHFPLMNSPEYTPPGYYVYSSDHEFARCYPGLYAIPFYHPVSHHHPTQNGYHPPPPPPPPGVYHQPYVYQEPSDGYFHSNIRTSGQENERVRESTKLDGLTKDSECHREEYLVALNKDE